MKTHSLTFPEIALIAGTRAIFGAGVALLVGDKMAPAQKRAVGWTLVAIGALTTIPLVLEVLDRSDEE